MEELRLLAFLKEDPFRAHAEIAPLEMIPPFLSRTEVWGLLSCPDGDFGDSFLLLWTIYSSSRAFTPFRKLKDYSLYG